MQAPIFSAVYKSLLTFPYQLAFSLATNAIKKRAQDYKIMSGGVSIGGFNIIFGRFFLSRFVSFSTI